MDESPAAAPPATGEQVAALTTPPHVSRDALRHTVIMLLCAAATLMQIALAGYALFAPAQVALPFLALALTHGVLLLLAVLGGVLARRGHVIAAMSCLVGSLLPVVFVAQTVAISAGSSANVDSFLAVVYPLIIVLAGISTNRRFVLVVAGISAVLSFIITVIVPTSAQVSLLVGMLAAEVATTAITLLFAAAYTASEHDLAEARLAYERMRQIDSLKEQFITSVNHELRNPIMAMLGYLDLLRVQRNRASLDRLDLIVSEANQAGQDLRALLNSILETRRLDQGIENFTPQAVNVRETIAVAVRLIDPREANMQDRELRIRVAPHFHIWGDPVHLQQIFTNLISNAVKYSPPDAPVEVTAAHVMDNYEVAGRWGRTEMQSRKMVEILVRDYGLGIPPEQAPLLFQRFARLPRDLASKVVGNGLGLYLCRALAEVMGGKIWVESDGVPGKGSSFFVRLPIPYEEPTPPSPIETSKAEIRL